jgi:hypothetical protein
MSKFAVFLFDCSLAVATALLASVLVGLMYGFTLAYFGAIY